MHDHLATHQANHTVDRGLQRWRELVGKSTDFADLGPDEDDFGQRPAPEHDRKGGQEMPDSERMEAELRAGRVDVAHGETMDTAGSATCPQRVDDHRFAATIEVTDRTEACDSSVEKLHLARRLWQFAKAPEDMAAEAVVTLPGISEAYDVDHPPVSNIRLGK
jgi:hypothetical protein